MTLITKGMGVIAKHLLKKSKKFPGPKADMLLNRKVRQRLRPKGDPHPVSGFKKQTKVGGIKGKIGAGDIDVHARKAMGDDWPLRWFSFQTRRRC